MAHMTGTTDRELKKGSAELLVLTLVETRARHGYEIGKQIDERSGGALHYNIASLYPLLYRMEKRGWTRGAWETTSGGVKRRCYSLTAAGLKQLAASRREWSVFFRALDQLGGLSRA